MPTCRRKRARNAMGEDAFLQRVQDALRRHGMIRPGERVLCAVSGGADSVALLRAMCALADGEGFTVVACHMEHGIRGDASMEDRRFVEALCQELDVRLLVKSVDVPSLARQWGLGLETAARDARHAFYQQAMETLHCDSVGLGHHLDDQAETVFMQLSRGARGPLGMRPAAQGYIRPLIEIARADIGAWLGEHGWPHREDASNQVADNPRNAIRLKMLPELIRWYPGATEAIGRAAEYARQDDDYLMALAREWLKGTDGVPRPPWPVEPVLRRGLALYVQGCGAGEALSADLLGRLMELALSGRTGQRVGIGAWLWERGKGGALHRVNEENWMGESPLPVPGQADTPYGRFIAQLWKEWDGPMPDGRSIQLLDADRLPPLTARTRRPGDRMRPLGAPGERKLKDILIDRGIPKALRDSLPLLAHQNHIYWLPGLPPAEEAKVTKDTRRYALIEYKGEYDESSI